MDLIIRTKQAVRALDNMNYKRMIKILGNEPNNEDTVSESSDAGGESDGIKDMVWFWNIICYTYEDLFAWKIFKFLSENRVLGVEW